MTIDNLLEFRIFLDLGPNDPCWGRPGPKREHKPVPGTVAVSGHGDGLMKPTGKGKRRRRKRRRKRVNQFRKIGTNLQ